ncbi:MAG: dcd [Mucilaginibacter sp.]|nr:dcd [Mucilaginibacter sp.]
MGFKKTETAQLYLFELIERTSRFYLHLDEIISEFYRGADSKVEDKLIFIESYKTWLMKIIEMSIKLNTKILLCDNEQEAINKIMTNIKRLLNSLNILHKRYLNHLPRPSEPIELRRFSRMIDKHVVSLNNKKTQTEGENKDSKQISIYVSEELGDSVYVKDPLQQFKDETLDKLILDFNNDFEENIRSFDTSDNNQNTIHITIPRIDTNNPCRWPTLLHELGHNIIDNKFFQSGDIEKEFEGFLTLGQIDVLNSYKSKSDVNIKSWLTECWCDLFACVVLGPAFWFSQYSSFIFETGSNYNVNYPIPLFRLKLIYNILQHRFEKTLFNDLTKTLELSETIIEYFDESDTSGFKNEDNREVYIYFREFFRKYFFKIDNSDLKFGTEAVNVLLQPLIKYTEEIEEDTIRSLSNLLIQGLPIPSKQINKTYLAEKPTYVQEILLSAWLYRNNGLKDEILINLASLNLNDLINSYEKNILKVFKRFDQSILRSIQVSEWFDLFYSEAKYKTETEFEDKLTPHLSISNTGISQLSDINIFQLLKSNKLKVIPLMDLNEQLGATSLDVRLGTSFQLYYQNKYGIIDFTDQQSLNDAEFNSRLIDLDYMESITISPGQFILGHTMEYFKLPENIAAEIEGRSSFARLGLEIHMTAGFIDPGFEGVITLEIYNAGPNPVKLFPGLRFGQLKFINIDSPLRPYNKRHHAKYKGLLSHHTSMQYKDYEITQIKKELTKKQINKEK